MITKIARKRNNLKCGRMITKIVRKRNELKMRQNDNEDRS